MKENDNKSKSMKVSFLPLGLSTQNNQRKREKFHFGSQAQRF